MAGSAANISGNLANIIGGPISYSENETRVMAPDANLARMGNGLFGKGAGAVDLTDPASLEAEAQRLFNKGDRAGAAAMMNQAEQLRAAARAQSNEARAQAGAVRAEAGEGRAVRNEQRTVRADQDAKMEKMKARRTAAGKKIDEAGLELEEQAIRERLIPVAQQAGVVTEGLTNAQIANELNSRGAAAATAAQAALGDTGLAQQQVDHLYELADQATTDNDRDAIRRLAEGVANGKKYDGALTEAVKRLDPEGTSFPTEGERKNIKKQFKKIDDAWNDANDDEWFLIADAAAKIKRNNPNLSVEEIAAMLKDSYVKESGPGAIARMWQAITAPAPSGTVAGAPELPGEDDLVNKYGGPQ